MADTTLLGLIHGKGAHVDPVACVEDLTAALAARTAAGYPHSIWQILEHINYWMDYDLAKIAGENRPYPRKAIESWPQYPNPDEGRSPDEQWQASVRRFLELLDRLSRLANSDTAALERKISNVGSPLAPREATIHAMLWQIAAHNSYHTGQIALLRRQFGAWPPRRGGDTW